MIGDVTPKDVADDSTVMAGHVMAPFAAPLNVCQSAAVNRPMLEDVAVVMSTVTFGPTVEEDPPVMVTPLVEVEMFPLL